LHNCVRTMNPLYQALICCLVKLVFSIRKSMSSFGSFLLPLEPIAAAARAPGWSRDSGLSVRRSRTRQMAPTSPVFTGPIIDLARTCRRVHTQKTVYCVHLLLNSSNQLSDRNSWPGVDETWVIKAQYAVNVRSVKWLRIHARPFGSNRISTKFVLYLHLA